MRRLGETQQEASHQLLVVPVDQRIHTLLLQQRAQSDAARRHSLPQRRRQRLQRRERELRVQPTLRSYEAEKLLQLDVAEMGARLEKGDERGNRRRRRVARLQ